MCSDSITLLLSIKTNFGFGEITSKNSIMKIKKIYALVYFIFVFLSSTSILLSTSIQASNIKNSAVIFMYHKFGIEKYPSTNISLEQFKSHLQEFSQSKYNVKSIDFIIDTIINDGTLPENTIGITVDDADRSFLEIAWPLLKKYSFPVTLFVTTNTISPGNKKYLNWDEIRLLQSEGVTIGAHSNSHNHYTNMTTNEVKEDIEIANRIFLKELNKIPTLFAYPYGEVNEKHMDLLKDYKFKVAFGQHSGVLNETSNMYFLPRFSLNEKYGELERVSFAANAKGLGIYDFVPSNPNIFENPPYIGFSLLDEKLANNINCFLYDSKGKVEADIFKFNERIEIRLNRSLSNGRSRLNCTVKDYNGNWRWFGHQFYIGKN